MELANRLSMNNWPIRYKLMAFFLLISILPSIGLGMLVDWTTGRIIERQVNENTIQLIGKVNEGLEAYVGNMQNITYMVSLNQDVLHFLQEGATRGENDDHYRMRKFLQSFTSLYPEIAGILIANESGEYLSNEMYAKTGNLLTTETWYREAVANKGIFKIIGHPYGRNLANHYNYKDSEVVSVVRAVLDPQSQQVLGVVLIDLKLRVIAETVKDVHLGKTGYLTVIDQDGGAIYAPPEPFFEHIPKEWLGNATSGTLTKEIGQKAYQLIYQASTFTNWTTVGVFSTEEAVFEMQEIRFYLVSFVFFGCLFGLTASLYLAFSISRPMNQLMSFMQKAESGDLTIRYIGQRSDEIGLLGRSFNKMLLQLNRLLSLTELQERQKREAELRTLQAHIKPHFLYNTLDTIHWLARNQGAQDVAEVTESLSKLFRIGLSKGKDVIAVTEELEHIRSYLNIQQTRYRDKLTCELDVDPEALPLYVVKLVLQPLVENAIYHGIKERRGPGSIRIEVAAADGMLRMRVSDDGVGIEPERLQKLRAALEDEVAKSKETAHAGTLAAGYGYGLRNVHARIRLTFGAPYGLTIDSERGKGTVVTILHPILRDPPEALDEKKKEGLE